ncbi:beta-1,3-galactosyltransferase 5-like [Oculina patagonica]
MGFVRRKSTIYVSLLIAGTVTVTLIFSIIPYLNRFIPLNKRDKQGALHFNVIVQAASPIKKVEPLPHRTYLISRKRCTEKLFLLIMVFTAPANFDRRNIIRKTWASDPSLKARWKTMFLLGQAVGDSTEKKYLEDEGLKYGDFIRGTQNENYYNLTLKTQMGVEWAAKYCDFQFLLKADDDVFVNPYRLMEYLGNSDTPKTELYLGRVASSGIVHRRGKYAVSVEEYNGTRYPAFCNGPAYLLSWDLVNKLVDLFDVKKPLKLEDVYIGTLVDKLGVKPVRHRGFRLLQFGSSSCKHYSDTVVYHKASIQCTEELFTEAMKERAEEELTKSGTVNTGENISRLEIMTPKTI